MKTKSESGVSVSDVCSMKGSATAVRREGLGGKES